MARHSLSLTGLLFGICISSSSLTHAAGFQISEISVSGLGRAFAGTGISGESTSDMFFNPASLGLRTGSEFEVGVHILSTSAEFENRGSSQTLLTQGRLSSSGPNSNAGNTSGIPNLYLSGDMSEQFRYGISITSPFGLATEYDSDWVGRYAAIQSELITLEINPSLSYRFGNALIGAGITVIHADAKLTNAQFTGLGSPDGLTVLKGDDTVVGFTLGFVGENEVGRIGAGFRSEATLDIEGDVSISPLNINTGAKSRITLPQTLYLSGLLKKQSNLDLLASIRFTDWSVFEELRIQLNNGLPDLVIPENWSDTLTTSIGFNYRPNQQWVYRGGLAYDESATDDEFRTARIPDADRFWLSLGGSYQASSKVRIDFGYAHIFADKVNLAESNDLISAAPGTATDNLIGRYTDTDANIFSVAVSIKLGK